MHRLKVMPLSSRWAHYMHDELIKHNKQGEAGVADFLAKVRCLPLRVKCCVEA